MAHASINEDEFGEVLNGEHTYDTIVSVLEGSGSVVFGWTDEVGSHLDILMTLRPYQFGHLQRGLKGATDLFVSIMGVGAHSFRAQGDPKAPTHPGYYGEKLKLGGSNDTTVALAELINNVRERL